MANRTTFSSWTMPPSRNCRIAKNAGGVDSRTEEQQQSLEQDHDGSDMWSMSMNCRWAKRITSNPDILVGKPIVVGTRISVELILDCMASGWSIEQVVEAYPHITSEDVLAALAFAADVLRKKPFVTVAEIEELVKGKNDFDLCP